FSSRRRHTRFSRDWSSDVCSSDLARDRVLLAVGAGVLVVEAVLARDVRRLPRDRRVEAAAGAAHEPTEAVRQLRVAPAEVVEERSEERRVGKERAYWWTARHHKVN